MQWPCCASDVPQPIRHKHLMLLAPKALGVAARIRTVYMGRLSRRPLMRLKPKESAIRDSERWLERHAAACEIGETCESSETQGTHQHQGDASPHVYDIILIV